jgi:hypothetical protein
MEDLLFICAALAATTMASAHYIAERWVGREMHRIACYVAGLLFGILMPYAMWVHLADKYAACVGVDITNWKSFVALLGITAGAGIGTAFSYVSDAIGGQKATFDG